MKELSIEAESIFPLFVNGHWTQLSTLTIHCNLCFFKKSQAHHSSSPGRGAQGYLKAEKRLNWKYVWLHQGLFKVSGLAVPKYWWKPRLLTAVGKQGRREMAVYCSTRPYRLAREKRTPAKRTDPPRAGATSWICTGRARARPCWPNFW